MFQIGSKTMRRQVLSTLVPPPSSWGKNCHEILRLAVAIQLMERKRVTFRCNRSFQKLQTKQSFWRLWRPLMRQSTEISPHTVAFEYNRSPGRPDIHGYTQIWKDRFENNAVGATGYIQIGAEIT